MMDLIAQQAALFRAFLVAARNRGVPKRVLERAADKVLAGPDGALRFSNALKYVRLSMEVPAPLVPSWKKLTRQAVVLMDVLFDELRRGLEQQKPAAELEAIRRKIEDLGKEVRVAGVILGLLAPWKPRKGRKNGVIRLGPWEEHKHLFGPAKQVKWRFPWIQAAIDFLSSKRVIAASEFAGLSLDEQQAAFTAPGIEDAGELRKLRDELAGGVKEGESYANFQKRVGDGLALTRAQTETVFRTNIHQGYIGGFERCMETPAIEDAFPAVMFNATNDNRVRDTHWDLDGFVCLKSDPAYKVLLRALKDWNCRCSLVPVSRKQAESLGLKTFADLPKEVVAKYGVGLAAV